MDPAELRWESATRTHAGCVRDANEDSYLDLSDIGLWAVADGMGGHDRGEVASDLIVRTLRQITAPSDGADFLAQARRQLSVANEELLSLAAERGPGVIIGSTVVVLLFFGAHFACLWAGDSRLYLLRRGAMRQITRDHSYVQELVDSGALTVEEAARHPQSSVLTRAIGAASTTDPEVRHDRLSAGDVLLLCTDGLTRVVSDREIATILGGPNVQDSADALIDLALSRGAPDNVTVSVVSVHA